MFGWEIDNPTGKIAQLNAKLIKLFETALQIIDRRDESLTGVFDHQNASDLLGLLDLFFELQKGVVLADDFPNNPLQENQRSVGLRDSEELPVLTLETFGRRYAPVRSIQG